MLHAAHRVVLSSIGLVALTAAATAASPPFGAAVRRLQESHPGVRLLVAGTQVTRLYGAPFGRGGTPSQAAESFLADHLDVLRVERADLVAAGRQPVMSGKFTAIYYRQTYKGVPVEDTNLTLLVRNDGNELVLAVADLVEIVEEIAVRPEVTAEQAVANVDAVLQPVPMTYSRPELVVYRGAERPTLAWKFVADNGLLADPVIRIYYVDALTGREVAWKSGIYYVDVSGNVRGMATPGTAPDQTGNGPALRALEDLRVTITNTGASAFTDPNGDYTVPNSGSGAVNVRAEVLGRFVDVNNQAGADLSVTQSVVPPGPGNFILNQAPTQLNTSQINALVHTDIVHDFVVDLDPNYPVIPGWRIPANVNIASTCNAFYDGSSINFYRAGGGCPNTAYSSVIYHEYGHGIVDKGHPAATGDYHEGMADATSALLLDDPCLGLDFSGLGTGCLRNAVNVVQYPCTGEAHSCGRVISGAFWDTKVAFQRDFGPQEIEVIRELWLASILLRPTRIDPGITVDVLTLDDDDNNINNGTPHYFQIAEGFGNHNLDAPPLASLSFSYPNGIPRTAAKAQPTTITVDIDGPLDPATPTLHYKLDGGSFVDVPMTLVGAGQVYEADIPGQPCGTDVRFYLSARTTFGLLLTDPPGGAAAPRRVYVVTGTITAIADNFETDLGWTVVSDPSLITGEWVRVDPVGTEFQPEDDNPLGTGTRCYVTGQGQPGEPGTESDVDEGPTTLISPPFDCTGGAAIIDWAQWYINWNNIDDPFTVQLRPDPASNWVTVLTRIGGQFAWEYPSIVVNDFFPPTNQVQMRLVAIDVPNNSVVEAAIDDVKVTIMQCEGAALPGDFDGDGDVDLSDFTQFQLCFGGSNNPPAPTCPPGVNADLDGDGDVDLADFLIFQQNFTGSL